MVHVRLLDARGNQFDSFDVRAGSNLWVFIRKRGHPIGSACSGVGVCGACHIRVVEQGEKSLGPASEFEVATLARNGKHSLDRLACLCRVFSDVSVQAEYW